MTETDTSRERPAYLICKRGAYYRPNSRGYTTSVIQAGRYTLAEAKAITHPNGFDGPRDGMTYIHEDEKDGDEDWAAYRALLARAEKAEEEIEALELALDIVVNEPQKAKVKRLKAERDTAWNDAIEAAAEVAETTLIGDTLSPSRRISSAIRALTPAPPTDTATKEESK